MKKLLILSSVLCVLVSTSANAQISVTLGTPVVYGAPAYYDPGYAEYHHRYPSQYYAHRGQNRHDDSAYWAAKGHDNGNHDHR